MPLAITLAHELAEKLTEVRKSGELDFLRPDGKTQVTLKYNGFKPTEISKVVVATQHETLAEYLFRFSEKQIYVLIVKLRMSAVMKTSERDSFNAVEGLCLVLRRLMFPVNVSRNR